ncbi:Crp/Fnr family transcriptional regulator [Actinoplanes sp. NPDC051861]|uniref:Crp/Fnr family transcriptional regulator n=1 Tax=Actinoplanes sp. NPDC051861 TaxID=3155170 RepID=UPI00343BD70D
MVVVDLHLQDPVPDSFATHLSPNTYLTLESAGVRRRYLAGTPLFHQGDLTRHVFLIEDGWVKITATSSRGWSALLALRGPGDIVGEMSALDSQPRMATVTTLTLVSGVLVPGERLDVCIANDPSVALAISRHLAKSLRESDNQRMQFGASNGDGRLVNVLIDLMDRVGKPGEYGAIRIDLPLSQQDLASSVGVSREVVARTLRVLRSRKTIETGRRSIVVLKPDVLRALGRSVSMSTEPS